MASGFMCDKDQSSMSFVVACAVFGDVRRSGPTFHGACGESLGNSRSEKRSIFPYKARRRDGTRKLRKRARSIIARTSTVHRGV